MSQDACRVDSLWRVNGSEAVPRLLDLLQAVRPTALALELTVTQKEFLTGGVTMWDEIARVAPHIRSLHLNLELERESTYVEPAHVYPVSPMHYESVDCD